MYFNTVNEVKRLEIQELFRNSTANIRFLNYQVTEILSDNLEMLIRAKAADAYRLAKVAVIVEHGALSIDHLNGYPGPLSKPMWDMLGDKICALIPPGESRAATAQSAVCFCDGKSRQVFLEKTRGQISANGRGTNGFQWDSIFIPDGSDRTYAEMSISEKLSFSQAAKAYNLLRTALHI